MTPDEEQEARESDSERVKQLRRRAHRFGLGLRRRQGGWNLGGDRTCATLDQVELILSEWEAAG